MSEQAALQGRSSGRRGLVRAVLGVLAIGVAGVVVRDLTPSTLARPGGSADAAALAVLDSDADQRSTAAQLAAAVAAMAGSAPAATRVAAACALADRMRVPLAPDVDRWVLANCVDEQEPHDGPRYDVGPLDRD